MASLSDLNERLFRELDRLEAVDDPDEIRTEVERARAIQGMASTAVANANTMLAAVRLQREAEMGVAGAVQVPKGLLGA
jgi:hypothetical protein